MTTLPADPGDQPSRAPSDTRPAWRRLVRPAIALAIGIGVTAALHASGTLADTDNSLQVMGFDPDRARLITDLVAAAIVVGAATLLTGAVIASSIAGIVAGAALFGHTFLRETRAAMQASDATGTFDPTGWVLTVVTLLVAFVIIAWATATLMRISRRALIAAARDVTSFVRGEHAIRRVGRPAGAAVVLALLVVALPVFGDMVNFSPDVRMHAGQTALTGLTGGASTSPTLPESSAPVTSVDQPTVLPGATVSPGLTATIGSGQTVSHMILKPGRPWAAWRPSGQGTVTNVLLSAPWTGGRSTNAMVEVYLPPGYSTSTMRYPVMYETPWGLNSWSKAVHIQNVLDTMIDTGAFPATIVVFASEAHGPYADSQCANAANGTEWFDTYVTNTLVPYVDSTYRTIPTPAARSTMGFSTGGYCAAMLALKHPDLFSTAISFSGYYQAGIISNQTLNGWRIFGGNANAEAPYTSLRLAGLLSPAQRRAAFLVLEANPNEAFYGPQYAAMVAAAHAAGISVAEYPSALGHSWNAERVLMPQVLVTLAQRQNALGVFG